MKKQQTRTPAAVQPCVYGQVHGHVYVVPRAVAEDWARLNRAFHRSATWGEVKARAPQGLCQEILAALGRRRIPDDRATSDVLERLVDVGFAPSLGQVMRWHLPPELAGLMLSEESALGEELPFLPPTALPQVLAALAALGIPCAEDQALIVAAAGYDTDRPEEMRS
jgi:hypothetical protein